MKKIPPLFAKKCNNKIEELRKIYYHRIIGINKLKNTINNIEMYGIDKEINKAIDSGIWDKAEKMVKNIKELEKQISFFQEKNSKDLDMEIMLLTFMGNNSIEIIEKASGVKIIVDNFSKRLI